MYIIYNTQFGHNFFTYVCKYILKNGMCKLGRNICRAHLSFTCITVHTSKFVILGRHELNMGWSGCNGWTAERGVFSRHDVLFGVNFLSVRWLVFLQISNTRRFSEKMHYGGRSFQRIKKIQVCFCKYALVERHKSLTGGPIRMDTPATYF